MRNCVAALVSISGGGLAQAQRPAPEGWLWPVWGTEACAADEAPPGRAGVLPPSLRAAAVAWRSPEALFPGRRIALFDGHKPNSAFDSGGDGPAPDAVEEADGARCLHSPMASRNTTRNPTRNASRNTSRNPSRNATRNASRNTSRFASRRASRNASPTSSRLGSPITSRYASPATSRDVSPLQSALASPSASRNVSRSASRHLLDGAERAAGDAGLGSAGGSGGLSAAGAGRGRGRRAAAIASVVPPKAPVGRDTLAAAFASAVTALLASSHGRAAKHTWTPAWHVIPWDSVLDAETDIQRTTYAVRLFHMGCWRRVVVNDELPVDANGDVLIPGTDNPSVLWPYVLFKAITLLASRTWTKDEEIHEFSVMECLSSAVLTEEPLASCSTEEVWALVKEHTSCNGRYRDDSERAVARLPSETKRLGSRCGGRKKRPPSEPPLEERTFVFAILQAPGGRRHALYLQKARVLAAPDMGTMERWRRVRWVEWARRHNVPFLEDKPYKVINVHGAFPQDELCSRGSSEPPWSRKAGRRDVLSEGTEAERKVSSSQRDLKFLLDGESEETEVKYQRRWFIIDDLMPHLKYLHVYRMPQFYASSYVISDIKKPSPEPSNGEVNRPSEEKDSEDFFLYSSEAYSEPVYVFVDSDNAKQLVFHLSIVPKESSPATPLRPISAASSAAAAVAAAAADADPVARGVVLFEDFCWWLPGAQVPFCVLRSVGASSAHLRLGAGRYVLRLWFSMHRCHFLLRCYADSRHLFVGARDDMLTRMGSNSVRVEALGCVLRDLFQDVHYLFGKHDCSQVLRDFHEVLTAVADRPAQTQRLLLDAVAQFVAAQRRRTSALTADKLRRALATVFSGARIQPARSSPSPSPPASPSPGTPRSGGTLAASLAGTERTFRTMRTTRTKLTALSRRAASTHSDGSPKVRRVRNMWPEGKVGGVASRQLHNGLDSQQLVSRLSGIWLFELIQKAESCSSARLAADCPIHCRAVN